MAYNGCAGQVTQTVDHGHSHVVEGMDAGYQAHDFKREAQGFQEDGQDDQHTAWYGSGSGGQDEAQDDDFDQGGKVHGNADGLCGQHEYNCQGQAGSVLVNLGTQGYGEG